MYITMYDKNLIGVCVCVFVCVSECVWARQHVPTITTYSGVS